MKTQSERLFEFLKTALEIRVSVKKDAKTYGGAEVLEKRIQVQLILKHPHTSEKTVIDQDDAIIEPDG